MKKTFKISLTLVVVVLLIFTLTQCIEEPTAPVLTALGGVVKDGNGELIEGANVTLSDKVAVTNSKGVYYIDDISSGSYTIKISKTYYTETEKNIVITTGLVSSEEHTIFRFGKIVGYVTNADGNGEEGVKITTTPTTIELLTDAEGNYSLLDLAAGNYVVKAEKEKFATITKPVIVTDGQMSNGDISVLTLGGISGKVIDGDRNPVEGVKITTTPATEEVITDVNGNYSLLELTSGSYVVKGEKEKFATFTKTVTVMDGQISNGDLSVLTLGGISGKVTDADSNPVEGVKITTTPTTTEVLTDASGNYSLLDLAAGSYVIKGEKEKFATFTKSVTVIDGQISNGDLSVLTLGGIFGIVTDADSNPLEGVKITTTPATTEVLTDANGSYSLLDLSAGDYTIEAEKSKYKTKTKTVTVTNGQLSNGDISILRLGGISGKVTDADNNPVEGVKITTSPATLEVFTDAEGNYNFIDLIAGSYDIMAEKETFSTFTKSVIVEDGKTTNGDISISTLGGISGTVTDGDSNPLEGVKITTTPATAEVLTDGEGNYSLLDLTAGSYTLQAEKTGYVNKTKAVAVIDGQISDGDIYISVRGSISGRVTDVDSNPLIGVKITTTPTTSDIFTDATGSYSILDLVAGSYVVKAEMEDLLNKTREVTVVDGEISNGDLTCLPCGIGTITYSGKNYNTVQIGDQCWLKENLDVGSMVQGSTNMSNNSSLEKYCYNNYPPNCEIYGGLYQWDEAMQYVTTEGTQGICPEGWHIPTGPEFQNLIAFVNGEAAKIVDQGQTTESYTATNETGFSLLFGGDRWYNSGDFFHLGASSALWGSTGFCNILLFNDYSIVSYGSTSYKGYGNSVRCLKD